MRSPQLALCAAVAACAVTTAPAYAEAGRGARTPQIAVVTAPAAHGPHRPAPTGPHSTETATDPARATAPVATAPDGTAPVLAARIHLAPHRVTAHRELSSTSAVALVLAGGAILVIAGQLLRLRLRLRRERQGGDSADEQ
ncbi:hypothetical protein ACFU90_12990 [Streptomyces noursei]|uniref:hypothetical protein n=1 Tax=Streptomyces noursei TaxID=1971 RepID=UPI00045F0F54|nr:hypothetical protein [Streptomyces noursei]AIA03800.1 hypothetical protein DC74_3303 [Streptomyces noursei]